MEFWDAKVKSRKTLTVKVPFGSVLQFSLAALGDLNGEEQGSVFLYITVGDKRLVLGALHPRRLPQQLFNRVIDTDFKISHSRQSGSVYFYGYRALQPIGLSECIGVEYESIEKELIPEKVRDKESDKSRIPEGEPIELEPNVITHQEPSGTGTWMVYKS